MAEALTHYTDSEFRVELLTPEAYAHFWPMISKELDKIPQYWTHWWTKEFLRGAIFNGVQIWGVGTENAMNLVVYTQVVHYPALNLFQIVLALGNNLDKALPILEAMFEKIAHDQGCQQFEIIGRRGWGRKLKRCQEIATTFRRDVPQFGVH